MEIIINKIQSKMTLTDEMETIVRRVLNKAAEVYGLSATTEVGVTLTNDEYMRELNNQYRGKNSPTDVLSFALNEGEEMDVIDGPEEVLLGDIIISLDTAERQAGEYGHSLERELAFLTVHGIMHLLGYDHETEDDRKEMRLEEEHILSMLGITRSKE